MFVAAALCGVAIGLLSGLLGVGGGTLMVPLLRLGFGLPAISATATSLFAIIPTSLTGFVTHVRNRTCIPAVGIAAGVGGALTSPVGVLAADASPSWMIMAAAAAIIGYSSYNMLRKAAAMPKPLSGEASSSAAPHPRPSRAERSGARAAAREALRAEMDAMRPDLGRRELAIAALIGMIAGFCSGYMGVGGGFIMVPLFISVLGIVMKQASGTSLIAILILAIPGVVTQGMLGNIDYVAGIALTVGTIPGAVLGATLIRFIPERTLRFVFAAFMLVAAAALVANEALPFLG